MNISFCNKSLLLAFLIAKTCVTTVKAEKLGFTVTSSLATDAPSTSSKPTSLFILSDKKDSISPTISPSPNISHAVTSNKGTTDESSSPILSTSTTSTSSSSNGTTVEPHLSLFATNNEIVPVPSMHPSKAPSTTAYPSQAPSTTTNPSQAPSTHPSQAPSTTVSPSQAPSTTVSPSQAPSTTVSPSQAPSTTAYPSQGPSMHPSKTPSTTVSPSQVPSMTASPSQAPSTTLSPTESSLGIGKKSLTEKLKAPEPVVAKDGKKGPSAVTSKKGMKRRESKAPISPVTKVGKKSLSVAVIAAVESIIPTASGYGSTVYSPQTASTSTTSESSRSGASAETPLSSLFMVNGKQEPKGKKGSKSAAPSKSLSPSRSPSLLPSHTPSITASPTIYPLGKGKKGLLGKKIKAPTSHVIKDAKVSYSTMITTIEAIIPAASGYGERKVSPSQPSSIGNTSESLGNGIIVESQLFMASSKGDPKKKKGSKSVAPSNSVSPFQAPSIGPSQIPSTTASPTMPPLGKGKKGLLGIKIKAPTSHVIKDAKVSNSAMIAAVEAATPTASGYGESKVSSSHTSSMSPTNASFINATFVELQLFMASSEGNTKKKKGSKSVAPSKSVSPSHAPSFGPSQAPSTTESPSQSPSTTTSPTKSPVGEGKQIKAPAPLVAKGGKKIGPMTLITMVESILPTSSEYGVSAASSQPSLTSTGGAFSRIGTFVEPQSSLLFMANSRKESKGGGSSKFRKSGRDSGKSKKGGKY